MQIVVTQMTQRHEIVGLALIMAVIVIELVYIEDSDSDDSTATLVYNQTRIHISRSADAVSYTHLTLPTILRV